MRPDRTAAVQSDASGASVIDLRSPDSGLPTILVAGFAGALGTGLGEIIRRDVGLNLVESHGKDADDVVTLISHHRPAVALVNQDAVEGVLEARRLVLAHSATGIVVGVLRHNRERDLRLLETGVRVVLPITIDARELCGILRLVAQGMVGSPRAQRGALEAGAGSLTGREIEVMRLLARQGSVRDIARELHLSEATVNTHRRRIYEKLGVHSRAQLAEQAARLLAGRRRRDDSIVAAPSDAMSFRRRATATIDAGRPTSAHMRAAIGTSRWSAGFRS